MGGREPRPTPRKYHVLSYPPPLLDPSQKNFLFFQFYNKFLCVCRNSNIMILFFQSVLKSLFDEPSLPPLSSYFDDFFFLPLPPSGAGLQYWLAPILIKTINKTYTFGSLTCIASYAHHLASHPPVECFELGLKQKVIQTPSPQLPLCLSWDMLSINHTKMSKKRGLLSQIMGEENSAKNAV